MKIKTLKAGLRRIAAFTFVFTVLLGGLASLPGLISTTEASGNSYETGFEWDADEEVRVPWPLESGVTPSGTTETNAGIGTAGFSYRQFHINDEGKTVLEFEISMFPQSESSASMTFRDKWKYAKFYIDPRLMELVNKEKSFFKMSYSPAEADLSLSPKYFLSQIGGTNWERTTNSPLLDNVFKLPIESVFPKMPSNSDYMKSKLYLVLNTTGDTLDTLKEDYAVAMRYYNADLTQVYQQAGTKKPSSPPRSTTVIGQYIYPAPAGQLETTITAAGFDDVNLVTTAPFRTASMSQMYQNVYMPMDMYRSTHQTVIYDCERSKLIVYYKMAPNQYLNGNQAKEGHFLDAYLGIAQTMDKRMFDALVEIDGKLGEMRMLDPAGAAWTSAVVSPIKKEHFVSGTTPTPGVETRTWRMFPKDLGNIGGPYAIASTSGIANVYLHGHEYFSDYVRFVYNVDRDKMDALFGESNKAAMSFATSYIAMDSTNNDAKQLTYTLEPRAEDINIAPGGTIVFSGSPQDLQPSMRAFFRVGLGTNYQRPIGNLKKTRPPLVNNGDPSSNGEGYSVAPYNSATKTCTLTVETGIRIGKDQKVTFTLFDTMTGQPDTINMTIAGTTYTFNIDYATTNANKVYNLPNAVARSGIAIYRRANTPHLDEIFTDSTSITGHSKYSGAEMTAELLYNGGTIKEFAGVKAETTGETFTAEGVERNDGTEGSGNQQGYPFTFSSDKWPTGIELKKDMEISVHNSDFSKFFLRSLPSTYRVQAKVTFDKNTGAADDEVVRIVPINKKAYGTAGYAPNGFEGDNILYLNNQGHDWTEGDGDKYFSDYEGKPITNQSSGDYKDRLFYGKAGGDELVRLNHTFLGWSKEEIDPANAATVFPNLTELTDIANWDDIENYIFTANSPVDKERTVYAVWAENSTIATPITGVTIQGTPQVGETLTAVTNPAEATATYRWLFCDTKDGSYTEIPDATGSTYKVAPEYFGKFIKVEVTGYGKYKGTKESAATSAVEADDLTAVSIDGIAQLGKTLTAVNLLPAGATATYQWQICSTADGTYEDILGATGETYIVAEADLGKYIKVVATGNGAYKGTATSNATEEVVRPIEFLYSEDYDIPEGIKGDSYTAKKALTATGGTGTLTFNVDPEVSGLSVDADNKLVYTRPEKQGQTTATIKVTDEANTSVTITINIGEVYLPLTFGGTYNISGLKAGQPIADANISSGNLNMYSYVTGGKAPYN
ncbi:MAG: hypothetical protein GX975_06665, partial [Clostridiales bacterium]|nr:hypothetical protein [Clostridiales bacterium]